ncbi:hypothetical protein FLAV_02184 [Flavobacteriales bacterium]|nr:hypothetical protein FLAV_02184 [Flavobacteriales bacterium]
MQTDKYFELNVNKRKQTFLFQHSYSYISIKKIVISSLFGNKPDEWFSKLMQSNPYLKIKCTKSSGETLEYPVVISSLVSPFHAQPVFEFQNNFVVPEQNMLNKSSFFLHYNNASIELCFNGKEDTEFKITLFYQLTPGANVEQEDL